MKKPKSEAATILEILKQFRKDKTELVTIWEGQFDDILKPNKQ